LNFLKYLLYLGQPTGFNYKILDELRKELPEDQMIAIKDLKWHRTFMSADGVAYYPNNCLIINNQTYCDKEVLEFMKDFGYDLDSYYSSRDFIKDNKIGLFNFLKRENKIFFVPDFYYATRPQCKYFLSYKTYGVVLCKDSKNFKYDDLYAYLPIEKGFLPVYVISGFFGEVVSKTLAILEDKKVTIYYDRDHEVSEQLKSTVFSCVSWTSYNEVPSNVKQKIKNGERHLEPLVKEIPDLISYLSSFLMIGRAEYTFTIINNLPFLIDINYGHPITRSMLSDDEYVEKMKNAILNHLNIEGSFFNGYV